jgi:hypothetical protein
MPKAGSPLAKGELCDGKALRCGARGKDINTPGARAFSCEENDVAEEVLLNH